MSTKVIAEIGWNFMGDLALAKQMISSARSAGADIAKFQYWNPAKLKPGPWDTDGRIDIYRAAALDAEKIETLSSLCAEVGIDFLISAFNASDAQFLVDLGVKTLKIPSHEVANEKLHTFASKNFEKVFVSWCWYAERGGSCLQYLQRHSEFECGYALRLHRSPIKPIFRASTTSAVNVLN